MDFSKSLEAFLTFFSADSIFNLSIENERYLDFSKEFFSCFFLVRVLRPILDPKISLNICHIKNALYVTHIGTYN